MKNIMQGGDIDSITPFYCKIRDFLTNNLPQNFSFMDFGCGIQLRLEQALLHDFPDIKMWGCDLNTPVRIVDNFSFERVDISAPWISRNAPFDVVFFSEVIEHIEFSDVLLENCLRNLKRGGFLICTIPNLASIYGRIELLAGFQPHILEASDRNPRIGSGIMGIKNNPGRSIHHIRGFTYRAMRELLEYHGFEVVMTKGYISNSFFKFFTIVTSLSSDILIVAQKRYNVKADIG